MRVCTRFGVIAALLLLAGCASHPLMQTAQATSTSSADAIDKTLNQAEQTPKTSAPASSPSVPSNVTQALLPPLQQSGGGELSSADNQFDVNADALPVRVFFQSLVKGTDYNVVVYPRVKGTISLHLHNVTLPQVMQVVSQMYNYDIQRAGNLYRVRDGGLQTRIFHIDYLDFKRKGKSEVQVSSGQVTQVDNNNGSSGSSYSGSSNTSNSSGNGSVDRVYGTQITTQTDSDFWHDLNTAVTTLIGNGDGRKVIVNPDAGLLIVRAMPNELDTVRDYLRRTQLIMQRQVIIEAKILEVELDKGYKQGIDWTDFHAMTSQLDASGNPTHSYTLGVGAPTVTNPDVGGVFSAALRIGDFQSLIQLLGKQGNVQVLSSPRVSTVNNQKAVIKVGTDEFFVTNINFNNLNNTNATTNTETSVQLTPFFSGISLDVTPEISKTGMITLHVHPSVSKVSDQNKVVTVGDKNVTLPLALSTVRETDSVIRARNGQIVVIGGLIQNTSKDNNTSVPFFGNLPLLGELFKQKDYSGTRSELVILLRPVVTNERVWQNDINSTHARFKQLRDQLRSAEAPAPLPAN